MAIWNDFYFAPYCRDTCGPIYCSILNHVLNSLKAIQIFGRVSGIDSAKIGRAVDPHFAREITETLAVQPDFTFTIRSRASSGQEQQAPQRFRVHEPPPILASDVEADKIIDIMKDRYSIHENDTPTILTERSQTATQWMKKLAAPFLDREQWQILVSLRNNKMNLTDLVNVMHSFNRDRTRQILDSRHLKGLSAFFAHNM
jgi:hypothetical protein